MSLKFNSDQQRIEGSGLVATGSWTNATYSRSGTTVTVVSVGHGLKTNEKIYIDFTSGGATDGNYDITRIDDDSFSRLIVQVAPSQQGRRVAKTKKISRSPR